MAGLGEILEQARLDRGASLDEAERATHISRRYLEALEAEDFSVFAAPVFMRGFLRTYSQYLGLDPADTLALLPDAPDAPPPPEPEPSPPETARAEFERRTRPLRDRQPPRGPSFRTGGTAPGPLTRVRVPATTSPTPIVRVAGVVAGGLIAVLVLGVIFSKAGGRGSAVAARSAAPASAPTAGASGQFKPTPPPPARKAGAMPNFVGKDGQAAIQQLQQVGVTPLVISVAGSNRNDRPGAVLRQDPSPGTALTTNSNVTLVMNQGPAATATTTAPGALPPLTTPTRSATATRAPTPAR